MELRHRHLADTPAGPGTGRPPDDREPHPADSRQADRPAAGTGPARDDAHHYEADRRDPGRHDPDRHDPDRHDPDRHDADRHDADRRGADRYDADAEFKRGIPKPPGYLPDDTGRLSPRSGAVPSSELHHDERTPAAIPRRDIDRGDTLRAHVDRPAINDPFETDTHQIAMEIPLTRPDGTRIPCFQRSTQSRAGRAGLGRRLRSYRCAWFGRCTPPRRHHRPGAPRARWNIQGVAQRSAADRLRCCPHRAQASTLTITPEMPVYDEDPATPACAKARGGTAWCACRGKGLRGGGPDLDYRTTSGLARRLGFAMRSRPGRQGGEFPFRTCSYRATYDCTRAQHPGNEQRYSPN